MSTSSTLFLAVIAALSCNHLGRPAAPAPPAPATPCKCDPAHAEIREIETQRDQCQAELKTVRETIVRRDKEVRVKTVTVPGPPRRCAREIPEKVPVDSVPIQPSLRCFDGSNQLRIVTQPGLRCYDDSNQLKLMTNLARCWKRLEEVQQCESAAN